MKIGSRVKIIGGPYVGRNGVIISHDHNGRWDWNVRVEDIALPNRAPYAEDELQIIGCPCAIKNCVSRHK